MDLEIMTQYSALLGDICNAYSIANSSSINSFIWQIYDYLGRWKWLFVSGFIIWTFIEISFRYGSFRYNSKNGFTPIYNAFVGSGVYFGLQTLFYLLVTKFIGSVAYCNIWPLAVHLGIFAVTGTLLRSIGFWSYEKSPMGNNHKRIKRISW